MSQEIVQWDEELAKEAKDIASRERTGVSQIGLRAGVMMYKGQQIPGNKLNAIIISSAVEFRYDTQAFDPNNITPPDCFALSLTGEEMVPCSESPHRQAERCDICLNSKWQANPRRPGKNHKPCKERRRLALLPEDVIREKNFKTAELAIMTIPVTSVKYWGTFVNGLLAEYRRPPWAMVTEITVRPNPQTQFEVNFKAVAEIPQEYLIDIRSRLGSANDQLLTPYDASGMTVPGSDPMETDGKDKRARKF